MNNWQNEFMAEYHRQELIGQREEIRLAEVATQSDVQYPNLFERTMYNLANWMIKTGKQLRKRYEAPAIVCNAPTTNSFAR